MKSKDMNDPIILNKRYQLNALLNHKNWKNVAIAIERLLLVEEKEKYYYGVDRYNF